jgi:hypothetical protein
VFCWRSLSSVADNEGAGGYFDHVVGDGFELVDLQYAGDLREESLKQAEVAAGDPFDRGDCLGVGEVVRVERSAESFPVPIEDEQELVATECPVASDALTATLVLAGAAVVGAGAVLALPRQEPPDTAVDVPSPGRTLGLIRARGPLRRTPGLTVAVAFSVAALPIYAVATAPAFGGAAAAGTLVAAYGIGNLLGSAGLMLRPLRRDADLLMSSLAVLVAATLILVMLTPTLPTSLIAFGPAGIANAMFFAATLAARSEYAPIEARGQIFIWVGALKIAAGSAGTAVAGATIAQTVWAPLLLGSGRSSRCRPSPRCTAGSPSSWKSRNRSCGSSSASS